MFPRHIIWRQRTKRSYGENNTLHSGGQHRSNHFAHLVPLINNMQTGKL